MGIFVDMGIFEVWEFLRYENIWDMGIFENRLLKERGGAKKNKNIYNWEAILMLCTNLINYIPIKQIILERIYSF